MSKSKGPDGKKKDVPVRKPNRAQAPKKEFCLEVGKTYADTIGNHAKVVKEDRYDDQGLPFKVEWISGKYKGCHFWTAADGTFFDKTMPGFNLVREVKTAKRSAKAAGRSRPKSPRNSGVTPKSPTPKPSRRAKP